MKAFRNSIGLIAVVLLAIALCPALAFAGDPSLSGADSIGLTDSTGSQPPSASTQAKGPRIPSAKAAKYYVTPKWDYQTQAATTTVSGIKFTASGSNTSYGLTLSVTYRGKTKFVDSMVRGYTTNGRYLVYSKGLKPVTIYSGSYSYATYKAGIYFLDLKTGTKRKIASGKDWTVYSANKTYVYCGAKGGSVIPGNVYAVTIKTKAKKRVYNGVVNQVVCSNKRVAFTSMRLQICCSTLYSCGVTGKARKTVANHVGDIRIKGDKILYLQAKSDLSKFRVMQCTFKGTGKKAVTKWSSDYRAFEDKYGLGA